MRKRIVAALLLAYLVFVADLTLLQFQGDPGINLVPFRQIGDDIREGGRNFVVNFLGNIGVFMPLGLALPLIRTRPTRARDVAVIAFILSLSIELAQYALGRRVADVDDVIMNTSGAVLGFAVGWFFRRRSRSSRVE